MTSADDAPFVSYAQNFEDVMLWKALRHVQRGRYIDIGAADPEACSVSYGLYRRGWRGIHVDPLPQKAQALREARPDEVVLETAIGIEKGWLEFYEIGDGIGLSTCDRETSEAHRDMGWEVRSFPVACRPLAEILDEHGQQDVHWLKIDVEGFEEQVIRSWSPSAVRPWVVLVESTLPGTPTPSHQGWDPLLVALGYRFVYFDGLNRFYISEAHPELAAAFATPPNFFDHFQIAAPHHFVALPAAPPPPEPPPSEPPPSAPPQPPPEPAPPRPLPVRLVRRLGGIPLRGLVSFLRHNPRLRANCLGLLQRVPPLRRLLSRLAWRFGGLEAAPAAPLPEPTAEPQVEPATQSGAEPLPETPAVAAAGPLEASASRLLTQARAHQASPLALR